MFVVYDAPQLNSVVFFSADELNLSYNPFGPVSLFFAKGPYEGRRICASGTRKSRTALL